MDADIDFIATLKRWVARALMVGTGALAGGGTIAGCSNGPDPVMIGYISAAQSGYETVLHHAEIGLDARSNAEAATELGVPFIADPDMTESMRTNFRRYGQILDEAEQYERGTLDPDSPVTPPGPSDGGE